MTGTKRKMVQSEDSSAKRQKPLPTKKVGAVRKPTVKTVQGLKHFFWSARWSIPKDREANWALEQQVPLLDFLKVNTVKKFVMQLEDSHMSKTDEEIREIYGENAVPTHNLHYQIQFKTEKRSRQSELFRAANESELFKGMEISVASTAGKNALKQYCMKADTRVAGPWSDKVIYLGEDLIKESQFTPFQKGVVRLVLHKKPGNRASYWFHCPDGGSGKSAIAKWLAYFHKIPTFTYAKAHDILFLASIFQGAKAYIVNLSKTKPADISEQELYNALEALKDGHFTSTKYKPLIVVQGRAHVIVFANHPPSLECMTRKRFIIKRLKPLPVEDIEDEDIFEACEGVEDMTAADVAMAHAELERKEQAVAQELELAKKMAYLKVAVDLPFTPSLEQEQKK